MKITAKQDTVLKKSDEPVQSSELPDNLKHEVNKGISFIVLAQRDMRQDHVMVSFDHEIGGFNTWLVYAPHWDGLEPKTKLRKAVV